MQFYELHATFRMVSTDTARRAVPRRQLSYLLHLWQSRKRNKYQLSLIDSRDKIVL